MKRRLDPAGTMEPRISLWRFTYSLIKSTSSSWGRNLALKPEPISRSHNSHSHSFSPPPRVRGCDWTLPTKDNNRQGFMVTHQRPASAHAPASPCDLPVYGSAKGSYVGREGGGRSGRGEKKIVVNVCFLTDVRLELNEYVFHNAYWALSRVHFGHWTACLHFLVRH